MAIFKTNNSFVKFLQKNTSQASSFPDNHQPNLAKKSAYTQPNTSQQGQATWIQKIQNDSHEGFC